MTTIQKVCLVCGHKCKRKLLERMYCVGVRGVHETASELALCPYGHGEMARVDGLVETNGVVTGRRL